MSAVVFDSVSIALGRQQILSDVSLAIKPGQFVGVLGPNGAGKTTMMRAILGLQPITRGRIEVLGGMPRRGNPAVGYLPQLRRAPGQVSITAGELLRSALNGERWGFPYSSGNDRRAVESVLARVGASDLGRRDVAELSGGERQRLFIAQAMLGNPKLLLLDEPLISLDPAYQRLIVDLVRAISRELDIAVLLSAHEINPLLHAVDQVLYLGGGHAAIGSLDEVINERVLSALYRTRVRVVRTEDRIFVLAEDGVLDGHDHHHDHREGVGHNA